MTPPPPSLRALTAELRALHQAWSHPDCGGEYVCLVDAGHEVGWVIETADHPDGVGREYVPGSVERECPICRGASTPDHPCSECRCTGRVHVPTPFDAVAAARRLLAAARDGDAS